jgi:hypothetical protein
MGANGRYIRVFEFKPFWAAARISNILLQNICNSLFHLISLYRTASEKVHNLKIRLKRALNSMHFFLVKRQTRNPGCEL